MRIHAFKHFIHEPLIKRNVIVVVDLFFFSWALKIQVSPNATAGQTMKTDASMPITILKKFALCFGGNRLLLKEAFVEET